MPVKKPAVFLDRDGVLTVEKSYVRNLNEMEIFPYSKDAVRLIHEKGYLAIVISNQSGIARGYFTEDDLKLMNDELMRQTDVDRIYYCPHHPEGKILEFRKICDCRKPKTGLIDKARNDFEIDMDNSYFVGDRSSDIKCGENAGIRTVLLESGYGTKKMEEKVKPDFAFDNLIEFAKSL